jgi:PhzF family phenazine biosynthesis protein
VIQKTVVHTRVFADRPEGGNPCAVVLDGDDLTVEQAMSLAARFGAETMLVTKPRTADADFGLRSFVPRYEMEMCVHGTVAATTVLRKSGRLPKTPARIDTLLGPISVTWREDADKELVVTAFQFPGTFSKLNPTPEEVSRALRIPSRMIRREFGPIVSVSTSRYKLIVPLESEEILNGLRPDFEMLWRLCDQYDTTGFYPFVEVRSGSPGNYAARQFPKRAGYDEDPATGTAACALGAYLATHHHPGDGWHYFQIRQGYAMAKPSRLEVGAYVDDGRVTRTCVTGKATILNESLETIPPVSAKG